MTKKVLDHDLIKVYGDRFDKWKNKTEKNKLIRMLYWGDEVEMPTPSQASDDTAARVDVRVYNYAAGAFQDGYIKKRKKKGKFLPIKLRSGPGKHLLEVIFVDVQQGDATLIMTPDRKLIIVDGGEEVFLARILASIFPGTTEAKPLKVEALVITQTVIGRFCDSALSTIMHTQIKNKKIKRFIALIMVDPCKINNSRLILTVSPL